MTVTADQIAQLRRMTAEPTTTTYSDAAITAYIERYPLMDALGHPPYVNSSTTPVTLVANTEWTATYDLNAAAADVWEEKAAAVSSQFDFSADGASFSLSQQYQQADKMTRHYRARRSASTITLIAVPRPADADGLESESA